MRTFPCLGIAAACLTFASGIAAAQSVPGEVQRGRALAERVCSTCHAVKAGPPRTLSTDIASFPSIADRPGMTAEVLAGRILIPHPAMPGVQLTMQELREVIAYILSLKRTN